MRDFNVHLVRNHVLQYIRRLRSYVSMLPDSEPEVHARLDGPEGVKTGARIADLVLQELGHPLPEMPKEGTSRTTRMSREVLGKAR